MGNIVIEAKNIPSDLIEYFEPIESKKGAMWTIPTQPSSLYHFATFPPALVETPIRAGCPEYVCTKCGKAREKVFDEEKVYQAQDVGGKSQMDSDLYSGKRFKDRYNVNHHFKGYTDCKCNAPFSPGVVMDIFGGACTTAEMALKLNRNFIMIELSKEYCEMGRKRLAPLLNQTKLEF